MPQLEEVFYFNLFIGCFISFLVSYFVISNQFCKKIFLLIFERKMFIQFYSIKTLSLLNLYYLLNQQLMINRYLLKKKILYIRKHIKFNLNYIEILLNNNFDKLLKFEEKFFKYRKERIINNIYINLKKNKHINIILHKYIKSI